jgi:hypothetical protein
MLAGHIWAAMRSTRSINCGQCLDAFGFTGFAASGQPLPNAPKATPLHHQRNNEKCLR